MLQKAVCLTLRNSHQVCRSATEMLLLYSKIRDGLRNMMYSRFYIVPCQGVTDLESPRLAGEMRGN